MGLRRSTKQRRLVLEAVKKRCDHPSADDIYLDVRAVDSKIGRATVYSNLHILAGEGEIAYVRVPGADRYDTRTELHYHLFCLGCHAVRDVEVPYRTELDREVSAATGYMLSRHRTVFEGYCPECRRQLEEQAAQKTE